MNILLLSRYDRLGSTSRVRFYQYMPYLEAHGIAVTVAPFLSDVYLSDLYNGKGRRPSAIIAAFSRRLRDVYSSARFDLIWIEKEALPWLPAWVERWLSSRSIPIVVDYDDATFHNYDRHRFQVVRRVLGKKIDEIMRRSALVIVGNGYLAERAKQAGALRVEILPSVIDLDRYSVVSQSLIQPFTIGWIGTPVTAQYLRAIEPALTEVCRGNIGRLVTIGSGNLRINGVQQESRAWSEATESSDVGSFDCGIMPLPDADFERGKCGYKLIQYMACGLPVVASPVGVNCDIVEHGINGFLANSCEEWKRAIITLRDDRELRRRMGVASRDKVEQHYCVQVTAPRLLLLLGSALTASK